MFTSLATNEMQIKSTLKFHLAPVRITIIENQQQQPMLARVHQGKRNPHTLLAKM
jgi:hypothetical protein